MTIALNLNNYNKNIVAEESGDYLPLAGNSEDTPVMGTVFNHAYYYAKTTGTRLLATETTLGAVDWLAVGY